MISTGLNGQMETRLSEFRFDYPTVIHCRPKQLMLKQLSFNKAPW